MKIGLLVGQNPYGTTEVFSCELKEALLEAGHECTLYPLNSDCFTDTLFQLFEDNPDLTCSFSDVTAGGVPLGECLQKTHLSILVDPAIYFLHQIKSSKSVVTCVDYEDVELLKKNGYSNVHYLPHAISKSHFEYEPKPDKEYEAVFFGTYIPFEEIRASWKERYGCLLSKSLENASEKVLNRGSKTIFEAVLSEFKEPPLESDLALFHHEIDLYVRGKDRCELISACSKQCMVDIWGEGVKGGEWKRFGSSSVRVHPSISFKETLEILKKSRYLINSTARFHHSGHERLLYALAYGALPITTKNPFINQFFPQYSLITYIPTQWDALEIKYELEALYKARKAASLFTWHQFISLFNNLN